MMKSREKTFEWKLLIAILWMVFNLSLAAWWIIFGLRNIDSTPHHKMLISEGVILILSLLLGGAALMYYTARERKRNEQIRQFFAAFGHDLQTSLASLRLQAESLAEDFRDSPSNPLLQRLVKDSVRLEIQLDNSLSLAQLDTSGLFIEKLSLKRILSSLEHHWPDFKLELVRDAEVMADRRALESLFRNLIQNAVIHGGATRLTVAPATPSGGQQGILLRDDGKGFQGKAKDLGRLFFRHNSRSGSGVGLFLVMTLTEKMGGSVRFDDPAAPAGTGFTVTLNLPAPGGAA